MPTQFARRKIKIRRANRQLEQASNYQEWLAAAKLHDELTDRQQWKLRDETSLYDSPEVRIRHDHLQRLIDQGDFSGVLYALNEGIHGNMGGMGRPVLYHQAKSGTKVLIDQYVALIVKALHVIENAPESDIPHLEKVDFFRRASHCYGRSALMMSGGAGVIYFHHGVAQTLINEDLLPNVLSGASAGSWICAQLGTMSNEELKAGHFDNFRYQVPYTDKVFAPLSILSGLSKDYEVQDIKQMAMDSFINDMTFQEAYEHTGRYINISIAPAEKHQSSRLLNAITSPNVYIRSAVDASSSIPGVVPSASLYAKGADGRPKPYLPSRKWVDGSFSQDLPAKRLARLFGVNHNIVSLINPLATPFVNDPKAQRRQSLSRSLISTPLLYAGKEALLSVEDYASKLGGSFISPAILIAHSVLDQEYTGDINIMLSKRDFRWLNVAFSYQADDIERLILAGKRATWPKLAMIRNTTVIARTLDEILERIDVQDISGLGKHTKRITRNA